jgi:hypothetical protein
MYQKKRAQPSKPDRENISMDYELKKINKTAGVSGQQRMLKRP